MNSRQTTTLEYNFFDVSRYILEDPSCVSLTELNRSLLYLFNNDIMMYSALNGQFKGLWWKSWYDGKFQTGYGIGDIVTANGIDEISFLQNNWNSVKKIADVINPVDLLPAFNRTDQEIVARYTTALGDIFHLGNRAQEQQLYISLADDNKSSIENELLWQPYLVTDYELSKKIYLLEASFRVGITEHENTYHTSLDKLDLADELYEQDPENNTSIYESLLKSYLPKDPREVLSGESSKWAEFLQNASSGQLLGIGTTSHEFFHIVKPLGDDNYRLETRLDTDGHITVSGYVPVALLTEIIPDKGTIEYNRWRTGGEKQYALRLDYPINSELSKLFFKQGTIIEPELEDLTSGGFYVRGPRDEVVPRGNTNMSTITKLMQNISQYLNKTVQQVGTFRSASDEWSLANFMVVEEGKYLPAKLNAEILTTTDRFFLFNLDKIGRLLEKGEYGKNGKKIPDPAQVHNHINSSGELDSTYAEYWELLSDLTRVENDQPIREINIRLKVTKDNIKDLLCETVDAVRNLRTVSYKDNPHDEHEAFKTKTFGDFIDEALDNNSGTKVTFDIIDLRNVKKTITNVPITYEKLTQKKVWKDLDEPVTNPNPPPATITKTQVIEVETTQYSDPHGKVVVNYQELLSVQASVKFPMEENSPAINDIVSNFSTTVPEIISEADKPNQEVYRIVTDDEDSKNTEILFFTNRCKTKTGDSVSLLSLVNMTAAQRQNTLHEDTLNGLALSDVATDLPKIKNLFVNAEMECAVSAKKSTIQELTSDANKDKVKCTILCSSTKYLDDLQLSLDTEIYNFFKIVDMRSDPTGDEDTPTPIDVLPDEDYEMVASDLRMIREFGTARSPVFRSVSYVNIMPDGSDMIKPSSTTPKYFINEWNFIRGQILTFSLPAACQAFSFEISGTVRQDGVENRDPSNYWRDWSIDDNEQTIANQWMNALYDYIRCVDLVICAHEFGKISEDTAYNTVAILISSISNMVNRMEGEILDKHFFPTLMNLRNIDLGLFTGLVQPITNYVNGSDSPLTPDSSDDSSDPTLYGDDSVSYKEVYELIDKAHGKIKLLNENFFLYNGLFEIYTFMADDYNINNTVARVKKRLLRRQIDTTFKDYDTTTDPAEKVQKLLEDIQDTIRRLTNVHCYETAAVLEKLYQKLHDLDTKYKSNKAVLDEDDDVNWPTSWTPVSGADPETDPGTIKANLLDKFTKGNVAEIEKYITETTQLFQEILNVAGILNDYIHKPGVDESTKNMYNDRLVYLRDYAKRLAHRSIDIARGYMGYLHIWGIILIDGRKDQEHREEYDNYFPTTKAHLRTLIDALAGFEDGSSMPEPLRDYSGGING